MKSLLVRVAAVALVAAAAGVGYAEPAQADACADADGVTVVVDFHELGGGVSQVCDPDGGGHSAAKLFTDNGFPLTYVSRQPGFVCRVSGKPADDPCVNTPPSDAYWGLFWSDGKSGSWTYSTVGAGSQKVPDGGYVAFSWQGDAGKSLPGVTPRKHGSGKPTKTPEPTHSPTPSHEASASPSPTRSESATASATSPSTTGSPTAPSTTKKPHPAESSASPVEESASSASASPVAVGSDTNDPDGSATSSTSSGAIAGWMVPAVLVLVAGTAGVTAYVRRRGSSGS